jgi:protein-S-isoprenylcysteine O-methyltransferase Ste14
MLGVVALLALVAGWSAVEAAWTAPEVPASRTLALPTGLLLLASHVCGVVEHVVSRTGSPVAALAGAVVMASGIALRLWAIATLGDAFATALDPAFITTSGPYRWLRHPSELGLIAAALGGAVMLGSWLALACTLALVSVSVERCRRENARLAFIRVRCNPVSPGGMFVNESNE